MEIDTSLGAARLAESPQLFEQFPYGLLVANREGRVLQLNHRARQTLLPADPAPIAEGWSCCELICQRLGSILGTGCMSEWTLRAEGELPEVRIDLEQGRLQTAAWVTTSVLDADRLLVLYHRPTALICRCERSASLRSRESTAQSTASGSRSALARCSNTWSASVVER
jgi:hypothetical protein